MTQDFGVFATNENQLTLIYSSASRMGKQTLGYVQATRDDLLAIDIAETKIGDTVWVSLADGLNKSLGDLFSTEHADSPDIADSSSFDTDDWLKLINKNPSLLQHPIAVNGKNFMQVTNPSEVLKFMDVDSAGLEKHNLGDEPTTSSTTNDESFI